MSPAELAVADGDERRYLIGPCGSPGFVNLLQVRRHQSCKAQTHRHITQRSWSPHRHQQTSRRPRRRHLRVPSCTVYTAMHSTFGLAAAHFFTSSHNLIHLHITTSLSSPGHRIDTDSHPHRCRCLRSSCPNESKLDPCSSTLACLFLSTQHIPPCTAHRSWPPATSAPRRHLC